MTALRLARRSVRRNLARSILVVALIALPVAGFTVADGLVRTMTDRDVDVDRAMGTADLRVNVTERKAFDVDRLLPAGSRAVPIAPRYIDGSLPLTVGYRLVRTKLDVVTLGDPLTGHLSRLTSGRLPDGPGEVLVTVSLAERLGVLDGDHVRPGTTLTVRPGATLTVADGPTVAVTGIAENPYYLTRQAVVARPGSLIEDALLDGSPHPLGYLVDLPDGVDVTAFARSWPAGESTVTTRESFVDETPAGGYLLGAMREPIALFAGLGLLGIVLTAGAAFTVGARRQTRELGLITAAGGAAKHVRRVVLAQGLVLGVLGAATGLVVGAAVTVLGTPFWELLIGQRIEALRFGWGELVVAAGVGVLASVVAALVPAFGVARMHPVDALAGRFRATTPRARLPLLHALLVTVGLVCVVASGALARHRVAANQEQWSGPEYAPPLDQTLTTGGILLGTVLAVTGLVLAAPGLVAVVGRLGRRLPLSGRLAVRDVVRYRRRTVAAVAAVTITVAASVATAFVFTTQLANETKTLPDNVVLAQLDGISRYDKAAHGDWQLAQAAAGMAAVPGAVVHEVNYASEDPQETGSAPIFVGDGQSPKRHCSSYPSAQLGIGDPALVELSTGREPNARLRSALAEGKIVVFDDCLVTSAGTVRIQVNVDEPAELPAYVAKRAPGTEHYDSLPGAFISSAAAAEHGWGAYAVSFAVTYPDSADVDALRTAAEDEGVGAHVEESVSDQTTDLYLVLAGVAALVALLGAGMTVGLSAAEGRSDLATLAALGAPPRQRRTLVGAQALVVTGQGTVAGLVLGCVVGYAAIPVAGALGLTVPWQHLLLTAVCVPLLTAAVVMAATPSRLPMIVRRQA